MHRARLADEPGPEFGEDAIRLHQRLPEPVGIPGVIAVVLLVVGKGDGQGYLGGRAMILTAISSSASVAIVSA